MSGRPPLIGVTGAIGAGKSAVLAAFARRGCAVLSADSVVHRLYEQPAVRDQVVARLGPEVLTTDRSVDRRAVATRVFADPDSLTWLEQLLHPLAEDELAQWADALRAKAAGFPLLVYESPLLFESGRADRFDRVLVVTADPATRAARVVARGGLAELESRSARLWPDERRCAAADDVVRNDGSTEELQQQIDDYIARYAER